MRYQHLCAAHVAEVQFNEATAWDLWNRSMHQGIRFYAHCQWHCADAHLATAFEIAQIRLQFCINREFSMLQLMKPFEFLVEIHIQNGSQTKVYALLNQVNRLSGKLQAQEKPLFDEALQGIVNRVRRAQPVNPRDTMAQLH